MQEAPPDPSPGLEKLLASRPVGGGDGHGHGRSRDDQVAALEKNTQDLENKLYEERFLWILAIVVLLDFFFLLDAESWTAPLVIGVLQLVGLIVLAGKCRVDPIMPLLDRFAGFFPNGQSGGKKD